MGKDIGAIAAAGYKTETLLGKRSGIGTKKPDARILAQGEGSVGFKELQVDGPFPVFVDVVIMINSVIGVPGTVPPMMNMKPLFIWATP